MGTVYINQGGTFQSPAAISCTYSVAANGRMTLTGSLCNVLLYLTSSSSGYYMSTDSTVAVGLDVAQTVPGGGFSSSTVNGETFFGGTQEVLSQNSSGEVDIVTFAGGTGANLLGNDVSDQSGGGFQQADDVEPLDNATVSSTGVITTTKNEVSNVGGMAIDATHFVIINNGGSSYPTITPFGPTSADSTVVVTITSPTSPPSVVENATQAITVSVTGSTTDMAAGVTWELNGLPSGSGYGSITGTFPHFTYTAPGAIPSPATFPITAISNSDISKTASINVTVTAPPITITLNGASSGSTTATVGGTVALTAVVTGSTNTAVTWTVSGAEAGTATNGSTQLGTVPGTSSSATYTAPMAMPTGNNPVTITATSQANPSATAALTVTINPLSFSPSNPVATATAINIPGNSTQASSVNFTLSTLTPTLGLGDIGLCPGTLEDTGECSAGVAPVTIAKGTTNQVVWLLGQGLTTGGGAAIATLNVSVSGTGGDVTVNSITPNPIFGGLTNIFFNVTVSASAASGARNLYVTNSATNEIVAFIGAIQIP